MKWFQKSFRRLLVDMHIPDWNEEFLRDFSAENYAEMMELARVDTAEIYAGSCLGLCYWPTEIGFRHRVCADGRDLLGEVIAACRKRNIGIQIYLNVWNRAAYDAHPEWRIVLGNGKGTVEHRGRYGLCCYNTPFADFFVGMLDELNSNYDCYGFWVDMIGNYEVCHCPACQERFRRETGLGKFPETADWNDPGWIALEKCRARWLGEFAARIAETVRKCHPERTVTLQSARIRCGRDSGADRRFLEAGDYLAGDFTGDRTEQSVICKLFSLLSTHHPMEFMTPRCEKLSHHTTERPLINLKMRAFAAIANQCSFTLIDAIDPLGTLDRRFYENAREVNSAYAAYEKYLSPDSRPVSDLGIYYAPDSLFNPVPQSWNNLWMDLPYGPLVDTLRARHLLFSFVREHQLAAVPLIVLPDAMALSGSECVELTEYVRGGGKIYASGFTSLWNPDSGKSADFRLAPLFGVHYAGEDTGKVGYIAPAGPNDLPGITATYPLMLDIPQPKITIEPDCAILGKLVLPISGPEEKYRFGSAISNPPLVKTDSPALVRRTFGKGEIIYCTGKIESEQFEFHRRVFTGLLQKLLECPVIQTNAPSCVECTLYDQPSHNRFVFSALNLPAELPPLPVYDLEFRLRLPPVRSVTAGQEAVPYPFEYRDGLLKIKIDRLDELAVFAIGYDK